MPDRKSKGTSRSVTRVGKLVEFNINTGIATLLRKMHPDWAKNGCIRSEEIHVIQGNRQARPDILVCHEMGVPVVIETEFNPALGVERDAKSRLGLNLKGNDDKIEQSIAVKVPEQLKNVVQSKMEKEIWKSEFEFCLFSLDKDQLEYPIRWPKTGWITGNLLDLADLIELSALSENVLNRGIEILEEKITDASIILRQKFANRQDILEKIADSLNQKDSEQTTCMAMSIVLNAIMFHKSLARTEGIKTFEEIWTSDLENKYHKEPLFEYWNYVINNINYLPIFKIALKILEPLDNKNCKIVLRLLFDAANRLEELGTIGRHDLCGRLFQRLIIDRKYLATYYTLPSSAALLAEIAMDRLNVNWSKVDEIKSLKVADFACGTGALLSASMHSMLMKHNRAGGNGISTHKKLVEEVLIGADIMPAATHLTASMIAGVYPENRFKKTLIFTLPYGDYSDESNVRSVSLGSLELLGNESLLSIFDTGERGVAAIEGYDTNADLSKEVPDESCDLIIMNPPYARPCGQESDKIGIPVPCFKGMSNSDEETKLMMKRLNSQLRTNEMVGNGHAGLGSDFFDIAHKKIKLGGVVALVLAETLLGGVAWKKMRQCIQENYTDVVIFTIVAQGQYERSFSADTGMSEVLIIATKSKDETKQPVRYVNLRRRPRSIAEAVLIARKVIREPKSKRITLGNEVVAESLIWDVLDNSAGIKHYETVKAAQGCSESKIVLPHVKKPIFIPITNLDSLGKVGVYHMKIVNTGKDKDGNFIGPFKKIQPPINNFPSYPMLWNHNALAETKLIVRPDSEGEAHENSEEIAERLWNETKSNLHFNRDFRLNSQPLAACYTERETIGGTAWPNVILDNTEWDIPVLLWANTTFGLISFWKTGTRQQQGRARISITLLLELPILDASKLSQSQLDQAKKIFEKFRAMEFKPANEAYRDSTRMQLDEVVLVELLGLSKDLLGDNQLNLLRKQWCDEPTVHGGKKTRPDVSEGL